MFGRSVQLDPQGSNERVRGGDLDSGLSRHGPTKVNKSHGPLQSE